MRIAVVGRVGATLTLLALCAVFGGCAAPRQTTRERSPAEVRAQIVRLLPSRTRDREGWASGIQSAFAALDIEPATRNLCATLAVAGQESTFVSDPAVPGLGRIARDEIDRRAGEHHVPQFVVRTALALSSSSGASFADRIAAVRTERELSLVYEDLIGRIPLGQRLFADSNPVRTGGPMQVSIEFAERHAREHPYPYPVDGSIRHEVFSRRGGLYFGIAHLLGYPVSYDRMLYRFADFNAGFYASRNAAFQNAVSLATGIPLALDGDLIDHASDRPGATERAVRALARQLAASDAQIHRTLELGERFDFEKAPLYERVFELAERRQHGPLPRAMLPRIALESPKITRKLTTKWFAERVDQRYRTCLAQGQ
jgi:hypothetical protein